MAHCVAGRNVGLAFCLSNHQQWLSWSCASGCLTTRVSDSHRPRAVSLSAGVHRSHSAVNETAGGCSLDSLGGFIVDTLSCTGMGAPRTHTLDKEPERPW